MAVVSKVALIKCQAAYGGLRYSIDQLALAFEDCGIETHVVDLQTFMLGDLGDRLRALGALDLVFSINICGDYRDPRGRTIFEATGAPHVVQLVDHPLHHIARLRRTPHHAAVLVVDRSHVRAIHKLFGPDHFAHVGFCPHAALGNPVDVPGTAEAFAAARPITALFPGTWSRPVQPQWDRFPEHVRTVFSTAADAVVSQEWLPALDAIDLVLVSHGLDPDDTNLSDDVKQELRILREAALFVDDLVRGHRRMQLVEKAAKSGLPLTVIGEGYGTELQRFPNVDCRGPVPFEEALQLMRRSRLVLNANANFGEGSHERVLSALIAGACAATDTSTFYTSEFQDGRDILLFRWTELERGIARINELARDPGALFEIAMAGREAACARHRWHNRVGTILAAARAVTGELRRAS
jgi:hypothetical protein